MTSLLVSAAMTSLLFESAMTSSKEKPETKSGSGFFLF
jgi:hypothetical protein